MPTPDRHPNAISEGTAPPKVQILRDRPLFFGREDYDRQIRNLSARDELHEDDVERFKRMGVI